MTIHHRMTSIVCAVAIIVPAAAQGAQTTGAPHQALAAGSTLSASSQRANPFRRLFQVPSPQPAPSAQAAAPRADEPRVVCGMTMIPADPNVDPGIAVRPSADGTRFTIRAVEPPICR